jgi:GMP synthase-like glutamine amidotransferase
MDRSRLWIIDPSVSRPEDQGVDEVARGWSGDVRLLRPALRPGDGPDPSSGYDTDAVVLLGSAASVHDDLPWLGPLSRWLQPIVDGTRLLPFLGVCFGHQLLAHVAGGRVRYLEPDRSKRIGIETSRFEGGRLVPGTHELRVVVSHCEAVTNLPARFREVATRIEGCVEAFEHETLPIHGVQFHPEAREDFASACGIGAERIDLRVREDGRRILDAFRQLSERRDPPSGASSPTRTGSAR